MFVTASMQSFLRSMYALGARKAKRASTANIRNIPIMTSACVNSFDCLTSVQGERERTLVLYEVFVIELHYLFY